MAEERKPALPWDVGSWTGWPIRLLVDNGGIGGWPLTGTVEEVVMGADGVTPVALHVSPGVDHHTLVIPWGRVIHASAVGPRGW